MSDLVMMWPQVRRADRLRVRWSFMWRGVITVAEEFKTSEAVNGALREVTEKKRASG